MFVCGGVRAGERGSFAPLSGRVESGAALSTKTQLSAVTRKYNKS